MNIARRDNSSGLGSEDNESNSSSLRDTTYKCGHRERRTYSVARCEIGVVFINTTHKYFGRGVEEWTRILYVGVE